MQSPRARVVVTPRELAGPGARVTGALSGRTRTMGQAWRPCARGLPLPTLAGAAAFALVPTTLVLVRHGHDLAGALVAAALVSGAASAFSVDDPAEETLAASPTGLARRRLLRLSALALGVAAIAVVLLMVAALADVRGLSAAELARRAAELGAVSGVAAAAAGAARRQEAAFAAHGGAVAGLLGILLVTALNYRFHALPALLDSPHHVRWWLIAATGWAVTAWTWRDPGRP